MNVYIFSCWRQLVDGFAHGLDKQICSYSCTSVAFTFGCLDRYLQSRHASFTLSYFKLIAPHDVVAYNLVSYHCRQLVDVLYTRLFMWFADSYHWVLVKLASLKRPGVRHWQWNLCAPTDSRRPRQVDVRSLRMDCLPLTLSSITWVKSVWLFLVCYVRAFVTSAP